MFEDQNGNRQFTTIATLTIVGLVLGAIALGAYLLSSPSITVFSWFIPTMIVLVASYFGCAHVTFDIGKLFYGCAMIAAVALACLFWFEGQPLYGAHDSGTSVGAVVCNPLSEAQSSCTFNHAVTWVDSRDSGRLPCIDPLPHSDTDYILWYIDDQSAEPHKWFRGHKPAVVLRYGFQAPPGETRSVSYRTVSAAAECK